MQIKVTTKIHKTMFEFNIEEKNDLEAIHKAAVLGNPPAYCPLCKNNEHFKLDSNKDKEGNTYVNIVCKCGAKAKLGQYKTGGYFWHKFEMYQKTTTNQTQPRPNFQPKQDVPFDPPANDSFDFPDSEFPG